MQFIKGIAIWTIENYSLNNFTSQTIENCLLNTFTPPNSTFCLYIQRTCVSALCRRWYNIFAGSFIREDEGVRDSIDDAYRHHSWKWQVQSLGYDEVEALNQAEVARNWRLPPRCLVDFGESQRHSFLA